MLIGVTVGFLGWFLLVTLLRLWFDRPNRHRQHMLKPICKVCWGNGCDSCDNSGLAV